MLAGASPELTASWWAAIACTSSASVVSPPRKRTNILAAPDRKRSAFSPGRCCIIVTRPCASVTGVSFWPAPSNLCFWTNSSIDGWWSTILSYTLCGWLAWQTILIISKRLTCLGVSEVTRTDLPWNISLASSPNTYKNGLMAFVAMVGVPFFIFQPCIGFEWTMNRFKASCVHVTPFPSKNLTADEYVLHLRG